MGARPAPMMASSSWKEVWYRFRCQVFVDGSGLRFLSDIQQFEAVQWQVHLPMSKTG